MKNVFTVLFIIVLFLFSCKTKQSPVSSEYEPIAGVSVPMDDVEKKYWDSLCDAERKNALKDIKSNQLSYTHIFGMVEMYRSDAEMDSLLSRYAIKTKKSGYYCMVPPSKQNCYSREMNKEIARRYGNTFIDSLRQKAEIIYVNKNKNKIFPFEECDMNSRYLKSNDYNEALKLVAEDFGRKPIILKILFTVRRKILIPQWKPILFSTKTETFPNRKLISDFRMTGIISFQDILWRSLRNS